VRHALWILALAFPLTASADVSHTVDHARILVKDVLASPPSGVADIDLGPAPPPGGSRLVTRDEIQTHLRERGVDVARLVIPASVRIIAASRRIGTAELAELARPAIELKLPPGVLLTKAQPTYEIVVPPTATVRAAELPRPPRQKGSFKSTATIELVSENEVVAKVPIPVVLEVSEDAARPDISRGGKLGLIIDHQSVRISTQGSLMADANIGDTVSVLVVSTGRVVKARIVTRDEAQVVDTQ
jgi:hypothetical protein